MRRTYTISDILSTVSNIMDEFVDEYLAVTMWRAITRMAEWRVSTAVALAALFLGTGPAAGHDVSRPAWPYCYSKCIEALEKSDPPEPRPCFMDENPMVCRAAREALNSEGDGGFAFRRFKTCNTLCKDIQ